MIKLRKTFDNFLVHDCKRGERWLLFLAAVLAIAARQSSISELNLTFDSTEHVTEEASVTASPVLSKSDSLLLVAQSLVGVPYRYGGNNSAGFDCSGYISYVYDKIGIEIGGSSRQQFQQGLPVGLTDTHPGDLIFFRGGSKVSHVGIVTRKNDGETFFIHASSSRGVVVDRLETNYFLSRLAGIRRIIPS